jgi:hypothetical protein
MAPFVEHRIVVYSKVVVGAGARITREQALSVAHSVHLLPYAVKM